MRQRIIISLVLISAITIVILQNISIVLSQENPGNIDTSLVTIYNRYRYVSTTITWKDGRTTTLKWFVVANIYVKEKWVNGAPVASWYIPAVEIRKDYNYESGNWWSGYHIDDYRLSESIFWHASYGYDDLAFSQSLIHYIPHQGNYEEGGSSEWSITLEFGYRALSVAITLTPSSSGKHKISVYTNPNYFAAYYDASDFNGAHAAYPYKHTYADWAVGLSCRVDKYEIGTITINRPTVHVAYHKWNYGGLSSDWDFKYFYLPIDGSQLQYEYDNYIDGYRAYYQVTDSGPWG